MQDVCFMFPALLARSPLGHRGLFTRLGLGRRFGFLENRLGWRARFRRTALLRRRHHLFVLVLGLDAGVIVVGRRRPFSGGLGRGRRRVFVTPQQPVKLSVLTKKKSLSFELNHPKTTKNTSYVLKKKQCFLFNKLKICEKIYKF